TSARAHDRDQHVARVDGVPAQLGVLGLGDTPLGAPAKLVPHGVVDPEDGDALLYELAVKQLATERTSANTPVRRVDQVSDWHKWPRSIGCRGCRREHSIASLLKHAERGTPLLTQLVSDIEQPGNVALLGEWRQRDL